MKTPFLFRSYKPPEAIKAMEIKPKVDFKVFATMCIHRFLDVDAITSLITLLQCPNPRFMFSRRRGDALIDRARAMEASRFLLKSDAEVFLSLDDDISYDPMDMVKLVRHVKEGDLDIVGAPYVLKTEGGGHLTSKLLPEHKTITLGKGGGIVQVRAVATGCMAVHRRVFERLAKDLPFCSTKEMDGFWPFFQPFPHYVEENKKWFYASEDWAFCIKAEQAGFKIWLDTSIKLQHAGRTTYSFDDFVRPPKEEIESLLYTEKFDG